LIIERKGVETSRLRLKTTMRVGTTPQKQKKEMASVRTGSLGGGEPRKDKTKGLNGVRLLRREKKEKQTSSEKERT